MYHKKHNVHDDREKLTHSLSNEWDEHWKIEDTTYVPIEEPYHDGYIYSLVIDEGAIRKTGQDVEQDLRKLQSMVVGELFSKEKKPEWLERFSLHDDFKVYRNKKDKEGKLVFLFNRFYVKNEQDKNIRVSVDYRYLIPLFFKYASINMKEVMMWDGRIRQEYFWVLSRQWRKYFHLKRYKRMITHEAVKSGEKESRGHFLHNKLFSREKLWYKYDERGYKNPDPWNRERESRRHAKQNLMRILED